MVISFDDDGGGEVKKLLSLFSIEAGEKTGMSVPVRLPS
jgi:hypothetical protein